MILIGKFSRDIDIKIDRENIGIDFVYWAPTPILIRIIANCASVQCPPLVHKNQVKQKMKQCYVQILIYS